jgi:outer membrane protein OmpA-like peptidoglycan-associated protein
MRIITAIFFILFATISFANDSTYSGTWQGVLIKAGHKMENGTVVYADFKVIDGVLTGKMREEVYDSEYFALKLLEGTVESNSLTFNQTVTQKNKKTSKMKWCRLKGTLNYNKQTGYMTGSFESTDCKRLLGKIILYRSDFEMSNTETSHVSHIWFNQFVKDYNEGLNAPEIRKIERDNFVFEPIFFDFDKSEIRDEHKAFLNRLIKVVKGHTDLRVKVTGHTDAIGSNGYNDGLSRRRAESIIQYFESQGLSKDRLEFDFKGETNPAATNETSEGRQKNRRVDFKFI